METVLSHSLQEYLKTIYELQEKTQKIRVTDIAEKMHCSKPSVTRALDTLKELAMIQKETYGEIVLTAEGACRAREIKLHYEVLKRFLTAVLEISEEEAEKEAKAMKNAVSEETIKRLEMYTRQITDVGDLDCAYSADSEKCRNCVKITAKARLRKSEKR